MTFFPWYPSDHHGGACAASATQRSGSLAKRKPLADEDGARKALGTDHPFPAAIAVGTSLEHLARIALG